MVVATIEGWGVSSGLGAANGLVGGGLGTQVGSEVSPATAGDGVTAVMGLGCAVVAAGVGSGNGSGAGGMGDSVASTPVGMTCLGIKYAIADEGVGFL